MTVATQDATQKEIQPIEEVERTYNRPVFTPRADIYETADAIEVIADLPGVKEEGLDITLEKTQLTIRGSVNFQEPEGFKPAYGDYEHGDYERSFVLSNSVDRERIEAALKEGVLRLHLPKVKEAMARKIPVKTG